MWINEEDNTVFVLHSTIFSCMVQFRYVQSRIVYQHVHKRRYHNEEHSLVYEKPAKYHCKESVFITKRQTKQYIQLDVHQ